MVRSSKLTVNLDILKILAYKGPMEITQLVDKIDLDQSVLEQCLDFLVRQDLVDEQNLGKDEKFYVITERGLKVLKVIVPIVEAARKIPALLH